MTSRRTGKTRLSGITLIEHLVTIAVMGVVAVLLVRAILPVRREGQRLKCLIHARTNAFSVLAYASDHLDAFRAPQPPSARGYSHTFHILNTYWWEQFSGHSRESPLLRCPANTPQRNACHTEHADYAIGVALYVRPETMMPPTRRPPRNVAGVARVSRTGDILFPSQKSVVYEHHVWPAWDRSIPEGVSVPNNDLLHRLTPGKLSVSFADGHARSYRPTDSAGWVSMPGYAGSGPFSSTTHGVRGVDVR